MVFLAEVQQFILLDWIDLFNNEASIMSLNDLFATLALSFIVNCLLKDTMVLFWIETHHYIFIFNAGPLSNSIKYFVLILIDFDIKFLFLLIIIILLLLLPFNNGWSVVIKCQIHQTILCVLVLLIYINKLGIMLIKILFKANGWVAKISTDFVLLFINITLWHILRSSVNDGSEKW